MPNCGHCADASARKASATKWGWEWIMDFQPAVSIMSVAWLKTEVLRIVTQFYKPNAQMHSGEEQARQNYCRRAAEY